MKCSRLKVLSCIALSLLLVSCDRTEKTKEQKKQLEPPKPASMLALVPDDTILFAGSSEPIPMQEWLQWNAAHFKVSTNILNPQIMRTIEEKAATDGQRMAVQLWEEYVATAVSPDTRFASWGFEDAPMFASYAIGLSPVLLRISLKDVQQFNSKIAALEAKAKVTAKPETVGTATCRRYALNAKKDGQEPLVSLVIGVDGNNAVFLIDVGVDSEQTLALALGQSKPEKSLAQSGRLKSLQEKYKLRLPWLFYLDHQQIIAGLTTTDGNRMAKMVQQLAAGLKEEQKKWLNELHSEGCRNDLQAIGANWSQTVSGITAFDLKAKPSRVDSLLAVESNDKPLLEGLKALHGFVPDYGSAVFAPAATSFAVGLSAENLGPFLTQQWTELAQKQYHCSFFKEMQSELKAKNPAAASMATGMAAGVRGLSFSLLSMVIEQSAGAKMPLPEQVDALVSLSAKNPAALVQTVSAFVPQLAAVKIPADGTPVKLPLPMQLPFTPMAAINGSHLTVYAGEKAGQMAKEMAKMPLESSPGFMAAAFDYGKYYGLMGDALANFSKDDAEAAVILEAMKNANMRLQINADVTDRGLELKTSMTSITN